MLEIVGSVVSAPQDSILIDKNGETKLLKDDDKIHFGDTIKNENHTQDVELNFINGNSIFIQAGNGLRVDSSVVIDESFGDEGVLSHESLAYLLNSPTFENELNINDILHDHAQALSTDGANTPIIDMGPEKNISIDDNINTDF